MSTWKNFVIIACCVVLVKSEISTTQTPNIVKFQDIVPSVENSEIARQPRSLIGDAPLGLQTVQTGAVPIVSNVQAIQQVPLVSNLQTIQQVPFYSAVQPIGGLGGGLLGAGVGAGGGFKKYHESYTVRARGFGGFGGAGLGKFGLGGGGIGGLAGAGIGGLGGGAIGGLGAGFGGGRYKARYSKSYKGGFAGAGLLGGAGVGAGGIGGALFG